MRTGAEPVRDSAGALAGLKVVDLSRVLGGPYCTMILADHGADVIKIEPPQGDETRDWGPPFAERADGSRDASYFLGVNRNKRGLSLDLSHPDGREVLLRLLADADVLVENFKPGTIERWGLDFESVLAPLYPRLVHCRISGFGADGPLGGLPGYDAAVQAVTGLMSINGEADRGPLRLGTPVVDLATGMFSAIAILMALQERNRSGRGQFIDMTLHDCGLALLHPHAPNYLVGGAQPRPTGNAHPNIVPYDKWPAREGEIFLAIGNDVQFRRLAEALGRPELGRDARFATNADRVRHRDELRAELAPLLAAEGARELADRLLRLGLPAGAVSTVADALASPQAVARAMVTEAGGLRSVGTPIKFSRTPARRRRAPPRFNQDGEDLLREAGYSDEDITSLAGSGAFVRRRAGR